MKKFTFEGVGYLIDDEIHCKQVTGEPEYLVLTQDFHCMGNNIPKGFKWNGASSPGTPVARWIAAKFYRNIIASCNHDFECALAKTDEERKRADKRYFILKEVVEKDVSWKNRLSWLGVRLGAFFGVGSNF